MNEWSFRGANRHLAGQARNVYKNAVRKGLLVPQPCELCGRKAEGHHEDYAEPLRVVWLCRKHHHWRHQGKTVDEMRRRAAA